MSNFTARILVVEDEIAQQETLAYNLEHQGYTVVVASDGEEAVFALRVQEFDLVLLDWMLPGGSGIELLRRLKQVESTRDIPVVMLTAKTHEDNVIQGLEVGADDYIAKPFAPKELIARMRAILRRLPETGAGDVLTVGNLVLEVDSHRVSLNSRPLDMGPTEFKLLHFFMSHPERAYSRTQLLDRIWGANVYVEERTVDVHIRRLRKALQEVDATYSDLIQTVRGTGYRFSPRDLTMS